MGADGEAEVSPVAPLAPPGTCYGLAKMEMAIVVTCGLMHSQAVIGRIAFFSSATALKQEGLGARYADVISCGFVAYSFAKIFAGMVVDCIGGKAGAHLACLIVGLASFSIFTASTFEVMLVAWVVSRFGQSLTWPSMTRVFTAWIPGDQLGSVWGLASVASRVSASAGGLVFGALLLQGLHWRQLFLASAIYSLCCGLIACLSLTNTREENNMPPLPKSASDGGAHPMDGLATREAMGKMLGNKMMLTALLLSFSATPVLDLESFLPLFLEESQGVTSGAANVLASFFATGNGLSAFLGGKLYDGKSGQWKCRFVVILVLLSQASITLLLLLLNQPGTNVGNGTNIVSTKQQAPYTVTFLLTMLGLTNGFLYYIPTSIFTVKFGGPERSATVTSLKDSVGVAGSLLMAYAVGYLQKSEWADWGHILGIFTAFKLMAGFLAVSFIYQMQAAGYLDDAPSAHKLKAERPSSPLTQYVEGYARKVEDRVPPFKKCVLVIKAAFGLSILTILAAVYQKVTSSF